MALFGILSGTIQLIEGSASVPLAVFGLWPKISALCKPTKRYLVTSVRLAGGTPVRATETVALPIFH